MVLAYYGHEADEVSLAMLCRTNVFGTRAKAIVEAIQELGFEGDYTFGQDFSVLTEALSKSRPPIVTIDAGIVHQRPEWAGYKHMIVIIHANDVTVTFHDPQVGSMLISRTELFLEAWKAKEKEVILIWPST